MAKAVGFLRASLQFGRFNDPWEETGVASRRSGVPRASLAAGITDWSRYSNPPDRATWTSPVPETTLPCPAYSNPSTWTRPSNQHRERLRA